MPASHGFFRRIAPQNDGWIEVVLFQLLSASLRMDSAGGRVLLSHPDFVRMGPPVFVPLLKNCRSLGFARDDNPSVVFDGWLSSSARLFLFGLVVFFFAEFPGGGEGAGQGVFVGFREDDVGRTH